MIYWALVFKIFEFVQGLIFFKLFIYEEICQSGMLYCFIATNNLNNAPTGQIKQLTRYHGIEPGKKTLDATWVMAPWVFDGFFLFYKATEQGLEAFN